MQTKDENKRIAIRDAVIEDVVENGLGNAPVGRIASRAAVSAGTIYIYYPNKEEMLQSIYLEIKGLLHAAMMDAYGKGANSAESLRNMWFAMFDFTMAHPDMFAFHEAISAEKILSPDQRASAVKMAVEIREKFETGVDDGTLKDMPVDCIASLYIAPGASLARRVIENGSRGDKPETVYRAIWDGISR